MTRRSCDSGRSSDILGYAVVRARRSGAAEVRDMKLTAMLGLGLLILGGAAAWGQSTVRKVV
ncbi:MAG TPA: hypothetical protein VF827_09390, partial [Syntrophales bacterium]